MANFNYLDFFKTPTETDRKLFIKDKNNNVVWTLSNFMIKSYIVQNNNIRINFSNEDFVIIDFNNVYESKIAISKLKDAIAFLNRKVPFEIDKDIQLYVDNAILDIIGPTGPAGPAFTELIPINDAIIDSSTSFSLLAGAFSTTNVQSFESFDNSQGLYLQATIPMVYGDVTGIDLGIFGTNYSYYIEMSQQSFDVHNPIGDYSFYDNNGLILSATYSEDFRFSLYSDGDDVYYSVNGIAVAASTYSSDSYYLYAFPTNTLLNTYTFSNVLYYPTGKRGLGDRYYATSSTFLAIPEIGYVVTLETQNKLAFRPGQTVLVLNDLDDYYTDPDYFTDGIGSGLFYGVINSYDKVTGSLSMVCSYSQLPGNTFSFWYINLSGAITSTGTSSIIGDFIFEGSMMSTLNEDEDIDIQTRGLAAFIVRDEDGNTNFEIAGTGPSGVGSNFIHQGDAIIHNDLILGGALYIDPYIKNRNGQYGWINITPGTYSVIDSFSNNFRSVKYLVSVDNQDGSGDTMTCEVTLSSSYNFSIDPVLTAYAIASTTGLQFVTFDVRRNIGNSTIIELIAYTPTSTTCFVTLLRQYVIYPND